MLFINFLTFWTYYVCAKRAVGIEAFIVGQMKIFYKSRIRMNAIVTLHSIVSITSEIDSLETCVVTKKRATSNINNLMTIYAASEQQFYRIGILGYIFALFSAF